MNAVFDVLDELADPLFRAWFRWVDRQGFSPAVERRLVVGPARCWCVSMARLRWLFTLPGGDRGDSPK